MPRTTGLEELWWQARILGSRVSKTCCILESRADMEKKVWVMGIFPKLAMVAVGIVYDRICRQVRIAHSLSGTTAPKLHPAGPVLLFPSTSIDWGCIQSCPRIMATCRSTKVNMTGHGAVLPYNCTSPILRSSYSHFQQLQGVSSHETPSLHQSLTFRSR